MCAKKFSVDMTLISPERKDDNIIRCSSYVFVSDLPCQSLGLTGLLERSPGLAKDLVFSYGGLDPRTLV